MFKKISKFALLVIISLSTSINSKATIDSIITDTDNLKPFNWEVISGVEKLVSTKDMSKSKIKKLEEGNALYSEGIEMMKKKNYIEAIEKFKLARKSYRMPLKDNPNYYNYININQALCYASSGKKSDFAVALRSISLVTRKIEKEKEWLYNLANANRMIEEYDAAISNLTLAIRLDENYFQAYKDLEAIHEMMGNNSKADRIRDRMETAAAKLIQKQQKKKRKSNAKNETNLEEKQFSYKSIKPNIKTLKIVKNDDPLQFNKMSLVKERSMPKVQEGVESYNKGVISLKNEDYENAIEELRHAEKRLKISKINDNGLNFTRGQLSIAYLNIPGKSKLGQVKRNLKYITNRLYDSRDWTYNMAVVNYDYATRMLERYKKDKKKWQEKAKKSEYLKNSIKLFKLTIRYDKLYLTAYQNLAYIYEEIGDENKAQKYLKQFKKQRDELLLSFDATTDGFDREGTIFRIYLGKFGEYEAPADMFDEPFLITVPIDERQTSYLAGMFEKFSEAKEYLNKMRKKGYQATIKAYKDGDDINF